MSRRTCPDSEPRRIALFRALQLGDLLCATPAMRAIRERFPRAEITLIGLPWAQEMLGRLPSIDSFQEFLGFPGIPEIPVNGAATELFLSEARRRRYDFFIQMQGDGTVSNGVAAAIGVARTAGHGPTRDHRLTARLDWCEEEHEVARWLRLSRAIDCPETDESIAFPLFPEDHERANSLLGDLTNNGGPIVVLHAGARDSRRRWPPEQFAELGNALVGRHNAHIVLTGTRQEREITGRVRDRLRVPAIDLIGRTDLGSFAAILARSDLLVTNDTGASHIAAALGATSIVLFGPSDPRRWAPLDRGLHTVVDAAEIAGGDRNSSLHRLAVGPVLSTCENKLFDHASPRVNRHLTAEEVSV
jgi:ADP-heptose:LPS heptosyltransferase